MLSLVVWTSDERELTWRQPLRRIATTGMTRRKRIRRRRAGGVNTEDEGLENWDVDAGEREKNRVGRETRDLRRASRMLKPPGTHNGYP